MNPFEVLSFEPYLFLLLTRFVDVDGAELVAEAVPLARGLAGRLDLGLRGHRDRVGDLPRHGPLLPGRDGRLAAGFRGRGTCENG